MKRLILLTLLPWLSLAANAQAGLNEHISLHPQQIARDADFLLLLEDTWSNGCAGEISVTAGTDFIDVLAVPAQVPPGSVCAAAVLPIRQLIEPRRLLTEGVQFAASVRVSYRRDNGSGPQLVEADTLVFSEQPNHAIGVETGTWSTPTLDNSGLFIDEQDGVLTAALLDYGSEGSATWF